MIKTLYRNELEKLFYRKKYLVFLILDILSGVVIAVAQMLTNLFTEGAISASTLFDGMLMNGFPLYMALFIPLMAVLGCADLFSGECHDRSLRMLIQRPVARWKIYLGKVLAIYTLCAVYVVAHFVSLVLIKLGFAHTWNGTLFALGAYALDLIPIFAVVAFFAFLHQLVDAPGSATALSLVFYLLLLAVGRYVDLGTGLVFTEYITWHTMWIGNALPPLVLLPKIGILLGSTVAFYCAGFELFDRKEI